MKESKTETHSSKEKKLAEWREKLHEIIFEADTPAGKMFDVILLWAILLSVITVMLETVSSFADNFHNALVILEWIFTILFTIEYILRLVSVGKPWKYVFSFMGMVDLLSVLPTYISLLIAGPQYLMVIRTIRLVRIFRILKLSRYLKEAAVLKQALRDSLVKIGIFIGGVLILVLLIGTLMYIIEGPEHGFTSIPTAMYWTIVTITTVGYGDIAPGTPIGKALASVIMLLGYGIIAVPTGIVTSQIINRKSNLDYNTRSCPECSREGHDANAKHCKYCGAVL